MAFQFTDVLPVEVRISLSPTPRTRKVFGSTGGRGGGPTLQRAGRAGIVLRGTQSVRRGDMFVYLWEYRVAPEQVERFLAHYGPEGTWVHLFRASAGFHGTELLRDRDDPTRFVTVDRWASRSAHAEFLESHGEAYAALDAECEALTLSELPMGYFESGGGPSPPGTAPRRTS